MRFVAARVTSKSILYLVVTVGAVLCFLPVFWLVRSSVMTLGDIFKFPPLFWPAHMRWQNFADAMKASPFPLYFRNTMIVVIPNVIGSLLTASMSAYGLARFRFPFRNVWFALVLGAIILPPAVVLIPQFLLWSRLHLVNTFFPLIVPVWFGGGAFNVFLLRQFFLTIPKDFDNAARIDGASYWRVYWQIMVPLIQPALLAVGLFQFLFTWNDFFTPLIYLSSKTTYTLAIGLRFFIGSYSTMWNSLMAASVIVIIPPVILFLIGQRYFVEGVTLTGIKG
ncbi:MAG TPA: carbohydrate ABC transporter permease [Spirochaetia bacterium]|nr:carbohydrate ABC transporter permease [Spirochaetia bacterium]